MATFVGSNGAVIEVTDRADTRLARTMETPAPTMDIICAWCDKHLGVKKDNLLVPGQDRRQTHPICDDCFEQQKREFSGPTSAS